MHIKPRCLHIDHQAQVKLDIEHLDTLLKNYKKVYPKEAIVGWYVEVM